MCRAAQLKLFGVTTLEDTSCHLSCWSLGERRGCLCTGWFGGAAEGEFTPER